MHYYSTQNFGAYYSHSSELYVFANVRLRPVITL